MSSGELNKTYDVVVVGGGSSWNRRFDCLDARGHRKFHRVGTFYCRSFIRRMPAETRFITPSFPSNSIGMLDLNSIAIGVSPAFSMSVEHPTGGEYAAHLRGVAKFFEIPVQEHTDVIHIKKINDDFCVETGEGTLQSQTCHLGRRRISIPASRWRRWRRAMPTYGYRT